MPRISPTTVDCYIDTPYLEASAAATRYVAAHASRILARLGDAAASPGSRTALEWLREAVDRRGEVAKVEKELADAATGLAAHSAVVGSSREMIDHVAAAYPDVLLGVRSGLAVLLKGESFALWESYFSSRNPLYDVHNRLAAEALQQCWGASPPPRILELGAGTGGATAAIVECLRAFPGGGASRFTISDVAPSLLRRTTERLKHSGVASVRIDFDQGFESQGIERGSVDIILATNALHASRDLCATLRQCRHALAPGGCLIVSESLCGGGEQVHQEFVFNLAPRNGAGHARASRFLSCGDWSQAFVGAGLDASLARNQHGPELAMLAVAVPGTRGGA